MSAGSRRRLVVGFGQEMRHDDAVGLHVVRRLRERRRIAAEIREAPEDPTGLVEEWAGADVDVVDAVRSGRVPGTVRVWRPSDPTRAGPFPSSSHGLSFGEAYRLSVALGTAPKTVRVLGIEAGDVSIGEGLSPAVAAAVPRVVAQIESTRPEDA